MRLLVVHPGASFATHDVYVGLHNALLKRGHQLLTYQLDARLDRSTSWLTYVWKKAGKPDPQPSQADIVYHASWEVTERALYYGVDGVLMVSGMYVHPKQLFLMRRAGIRTGIVFTESPYDDAAQRRLAQMVDVCWTNERSSVARLQSRENPNIYYLPPAYNPEVHAHLAEVPDESVPAHDVVFVGTCFAERVELLRAVDWSGIDLGLYGNWMTLSSRNKLRQHLRGTCVDNRYAVELYRRAKIGLNFHRQSMGFGPGAGRIDHAESLNPRAYELAACGVFQISDRRAEVVERFGASVPTFRDAADLERLIREYLDDARSRRRMATAARHAIAAETFDARAEQLEAQLAQAWAQPMAKGA